MKAPINTVSTVSKSPPALQSLPLMLLAQVNNYKSTGCLRVVTASCEWLLFLDQGQLNYITNSQCPFDRLDIYLRQFRSQAPTLINAVRIQVRLLFERGLNNNVIAADYQAICWLVEQGYLRLDQASKLVEALSTEVLEAFLGLFGGTYELIEADLLNNSPRYFYLNLHEIVKNCYTHLQQEQPQTNQLNDLSPYKLHEKTLVKPTQASLSSIDDGNQVGIPIDSLCTKSHYTIACIDDSPTVLQTINSFLDQGKFSVLMIDDPIKALMQLIRNKPDLILLDVTMPNLDGYKLCSLLRRHSQFKHIPIIMVTSNMGFIDQAKAKLVRATDYLTKPFGQSDLLNLLSKYLS